MQLDSIYCVEIILYSIWIFRILSQLKQNVNFGICITILQDAAKPFISMVNCRIISNKYIEYLDQSVNITKFLNYIAVFFYFSNLS